MENKQIQRCTVNFVKQIFSEDEDYFYFEGYGSTFDDVDLGNDVVVAGAFTDSLKKQLPQMLYMHDMYQPVGVWTSGIEDSKGLFLQGKMPKANSDCVNIYALLKCGAIKALSIGYYVDEFTMQNGIRYLQKLELLETSLVTFPMNPKAIITSVKTLVASEDLPIASKDTNWDSVKAEENLKKYMAANSATKLKGSQGFLYTEKDSEGTIQYKMPFADVVDGKLMIVPNGLICLANNLKNIEEYGNVFTDQQKIQIKSVVEKYYKKMGIDSPFGSVERKDKKDICDFETIGDVEDFLKEPYKLSKTERKVLISKIKGFSKMRDVSGEANNSIKVENDGRDVTDFSEKSVALLSILISDLQKSGEQNDRRIEPK